MDNITLGQIATGLALLVAIFGGFKYLNTMLTDTIEKQLKPVKEGFENAQKDLSMLKEVTYIMLSHMSTNNNTKEMQKVLDKYIAENIK